MLERIALTQGLPEFITVGNGTEFISKALNAWAYENGVKLHFIRPVKPTQNAYIENFNGKFRDECLNEHIFVSLDNARIKIDNWRRDYNDNRPHRSLNNMTPNEFVASFQTEITNSQLALSGG